MAIEGEAQSVTLTPVERTCRVMILCNAHDPVQNWSVEFTRGKIVRGADGNPIGPEDQTVGSVYRKFGQLAASEIPGGARTVTTYTDLMNLIADCGDALRQRDLDAIAVAEAAAQAAAKEAAAKKPPQENTEEKR